MARLGHGKVLPGKSLWLCWASALTLTTAIALQQLSASWIPLARFPIFAELESSDLRRLAREFQGPFFVPPGSSLFDVGEIGDFLYFVLAGEVVSRRGKKELRRYRRGGFIGETALLGPAPTRRIFSASAARGGAGCAVLRPSDFEYVIESSEFR